MSSSHPPLPQYDIPVFNGDDDAYGWVLDIDQLLAETGISSTSKLLIAASRLQGPPLQWWLQWSHHHPMASWESFIAPFLWHFKTEWQHLLPTPEEPIELAQELAHDLPSLEYVPIVTGDTIANSSCCKPQSGFPNTSTVIETGTKANACEETMSRMHTIEEKKDSESSDLKLPILNASPTMAMFSFSCRTTVIEPPNPLEENQNRTRWRPPSKPPDREVISARSSPFSSISWLGSIMHDSWPPTAERSEMMKMDSNRRSNPPPYTLDLPWIILEWVGSQCRCPSRARLNNPTKSLLSKQPDSNLNEVEHPPPPPEPPDLYCIRFYPTQIYHPCHVLSYMEILEKLYACHCDFFLFQRVGEHCNIRSCWNRLAQNHGFFLLPSNICFSFQFLTIFYVSRFIMVFIHLSPYKVVVIIIRSLLVRNPNIIVFGLTGKAQFGSEIGVGWVTNIVGQKVRVKYLLNLQNMVLIRINRPPIWKVFSHSMETLLSCQAFVVGMSINSVFSYMDLLRYLVHVVAGWFLFANFETPKIEGSLSGEGRGSPTNFPSLVSQSKLESKCVSIMCVTTTLISSRWEGILTSTCVNAFFNVTMFVSRVHFGGSPLELGKIISTHVLVGLNFQAALDLGCEDFINIHVREKRYMCGFTMRGLNFIVLVCCFIYSVTLSAYHQLSIVKGAWSLTSTLIMGSSREHQISHLLTSIGSYLIPLVEYKNLIPSLEFFFITIPNMIPQWLELLLIDMSNVYVNNVAMCSSWLLSQVQLVKTIGYSHEFECPEGREYLLGPSHGVGADSKVRKLLKAVVAADLRDLQNSNYVIPFGVEVSAMLLIFSIRSVTRQQWDPGGYFHMSKVLHSFQFKQWNPGQFILEENFYNLEDKVDFDGVGNDMIMEVKEIMTLLVYSRRGFLGICL